MKMKNIITVTQSSMPSFDEYVNIIKPLWDTRRLTNMGDYHKELEENLQTYLHIPCVSLTVNGHMALELAIQAMNFPPDSEVITTPFTFISTTHAIVRNGLKPIFCDIKLDDYTIDEWKIESLISQNTVAIIPVHVYGNICNIEEIERIASKYNLKVIYDAAHAFGELYKNKNVATFGDASIFSFHATKVFNTIEGGCVATHSALLYEHLYNLKNFGIRNEELIVGVGANAKMNEFSAAMGICNLKNVSNQISLRKQIVAYYLSYLSKVQTIVIPHYRTEFIDYNYSYFPVLFKSPNNSSYIRDLIYNELKLQGILSRKYFYPITSDAACFKNKYKNINLENARNVSNSILVLPLYPDLTLLQVQFICSIIIQSLKPFV